MALTITFNPDVPDSTYFTTGAVEPVLAGETLTLTHGRGSRRSSWGAPETTSTVALHADDLVSVHVGYHHKHRGGQFWRHYRRTADGWQQRTWAQLTDEERARILAAYHQPHVPGWAKVPGKLATERATPTSSARTAYKIVALWPDGSMRSVYDPETVYRLGKRMAQKARPDHEGGYYSYVNRDGMIRALRDGSLFPARLYAALGEHHVVVLEVEIAGTIVAYDRGGRALDATWPEEAAYKLASTYLTPMRVLDTIPVRPDQSTEVA